MALEPVRASLQGPTLLREWLLLEPHGPIYSVLALRHVAPLGHQAGREQWHGVPRVVGYAPIYGSPGPVYVRPGPVYVRPGSVYKDPGISIIILFSMK